MVTIKKNRGIIEISVYIDLFISYDFYLRKANFIAARVSKEREKELRIHLIASQSWTKYLATQYRSYDEHERVTLRLNTVCTTPRMEYLASLFFCNYNSYPNKQTHGISRPWSLYEQYCVARYFVRDSKMFK